MNHLAGPRNIRRYGMVSLFFVSLLPSVQLGFSAEPETSSASSQGQHNQPAEGGEIQERGLPNPRQGPSLGRAQMSVPSPPPGGGPPPNLCHPVTQMLTQCKCFNQTDCQSLTAICPVACPAGSQSCQCTPTFRGKAPALSPNLCGYQVPFTVTQCSCNNDAECQALATICPSACPVGSHSCQCTPMQRR